MKRAGRDGVEINPRDIELTAYPSRPSIELGESWEYFMRIDNYSPHDIWMADLTTVISVPAETVHPSFGGSIHQFCMFPTETEPLLLIPRATKIYQSIMIPAGSHYVVQWELETGEAQPEIMSGFATFWRHLKWNIFFHPGNYQVQAYVHLWPSRPDMVKLARVKQLQVYAQQLVETLQQTESDAQASDDAVMSTLRRSEPGDEPLTSELDLGVAMPEAARVDVQPSDENAAAQTQPNDETWSIDIDDELIHETRNAARLQETELSASLPLSITGKVEVTIRSTVVFFAAAFGGIVAFLLRTLNVMYLQEWTARELYLLPTHVLTAIVITLFVTRITEARFPLTIRVMDFWGATALGLVAAIGGHSLLNEVLQR